VKTKKRVERESREAARAVLSKGAPMVGRRRAVIEWLKTRPAALEFARAYLEMKDAGETEWSSKMVVEHLRREFGYPFQDDTRFLDRIRKGLTS